MSDAELKLAIAFAWLELLELEHGRRRLVDCPGIENVAKAIAEAKANPPPPPEELAPRWRVMRNCCTSGNCIACRDKTPVGVPVRVVQGDGYTKARAEKVAAGWPTYHATVEVMP